MRSVLDVARAPAAAAGAAVSPLAVILDAVLRDAAHRQIDLAVVADIGDLDRHNVPDIDDVLDAGHAAVAQVRDVHEAIAAGRHLYEGADGDDVLDRAGDDVADFRQLGRLAVVRQPAHRQVDLAVGADLLHLDLDNVADRDDVFDAPDALRAELGDVHEAIATRRQLDERADRDDRLDRAGEHVADLRLPGDALDALDRFVDALSIDASDERSE